MNAIENRSNYWASAGPAVALAVERQIYFKKLIKLFSSVPPDDIPYLLSIELCRWLDTGETINTFVKWISASSSNKIETKAQIIDGLKLGSNLAVCSALVELAEMLESICEKYAEREDTPEWRLMHIILENKEVVNLSTCLYNGFSKGGALYLSVYFSDVLELISSKLVALDVFKMSYKNSVYGETSDVFIKTDKNVLLPASNIFLNPEEDPVIREKVRRVVLLYFYQDRQKYFEKEKKTIAKLSGFNVKSLERQWRNWADEAAIKQVSRKRELIEDIEAVAKYLNDEQKKIADKHLNYISNK